MNSNNYTILHLDLSRDIDPNFNAGAEATYCVLWYHSVPLGQCYLDSKQSSNADNFYTECAKAVFPALQYYTTLLGIEHTLNPGNLSELRKICEKISAILHSEDVPETCDLAIVICTRNRADSLRTCLQALQLQRCRPAEIIVVDNASNTHDTKRVAMHFEGVRYVREDNIGLDIARNTGAREATASIVAYTDDDTLPDPFWVYRIFETFQKSDIVAMTGLVLAGSLKTEAEVIFEKYWPFNRGFLPKLYDSDFFNATLSGGPPVWEIGAGANMAFRKFIFDDTGYFDERLDVGAAGCSGDSELWYRILANGYKIEYNPLAVVQHFHRNSVEGLKRQLYSYMKGFTVAMLIQHQRFGHKGNLQHLFKVVPSYYLSLIKKGFPYYNFQYKTLFSEMRGILAGMLYYLRHRKTKARIYYGHDTF